MHATRGKHDMTRGHVQILSLNYCFLNPRTLWSHLSYFASTRTRYTGTKQDDMWTLVQILRSTLNFKVSCPIDMSNIRV